MASSAVRRSAGSNVRSHHSVRIGRASRRRAPPSASAAASASSGCGRGRERRRRSRATALRRDREQGEQALAEHLRIVVADQRLEAQQRHRGGILAVAPAPARPSCAPAPRGRRAARRSRPGSRGRGRAPAPARRCRAAPSRCRPCRPTPAPSARGGCPCGRAPPRRRRSVERVGDRRLGGAAGVALDRLDQEALEGRGQLGGQRVELELAGDRRRLAAACAELPPAPTRSSVERRGAGRIGADRGQSARACVRARRARAMATDLHEPGDECTSAPRAAAANRVESRAAAPRVGRGGAPRPARR